MFSDGVTTTLARSMRFEAVRKGGSDGLYAVISTGPAEVAEELTDAA